MTEPPKNGEAPADGSISSKESGKFKVVRLGTDLLELKTRSKSVTASAGSRRLRHAPTNSTHTSGYGLGNESLGSIGFEGNRGSKSLPQGARLTRRQAQQSAVARVMEQTSKLNAKFSQKMDFIETQRLQCVSMACELMQKTEELNQKVIVTLPAQLAGPDDEVIPGTKIPKNFYVEAMLSILAEKWKNRKFSLVHSEKMAALRTKYEAVQKIINNVIMASLKEKEQSERLRRKELKKDLLKKMVTQYDSSINRASTYQSTVGRKKEPYVKLVETEKKELTDSILHDSRLDLSLGQGSNTGGKPSHRRVEVPSLDEGFVRKETLGESSASPTFRNDGNDSFVHLKVYGIGANDFKNSFGFEVEKRRKDIKSTDKVLKDLRLKIDNTYMKFAKRTAWTTLYNREKVELAEENQAFRANLRNFRRKKEIGDNFLGGGSIEHLRPGILTNPLKNIYLETHKNKFDNPDARFFDKEDKEIFEEETKRLLELHLPEEYSHLQPKLLKILRETKHLDLSKQSIKAVRDINTQPTNPLADKWKLNLFCKYKADKYYKNMDFPKKARHRHQREEGEFESDSSDHEEPGEQRRLFIKEENEIDKYNSVNYMYAKSRSRRDQQQAELRKQQRDFSLNLVREEAISDSGSKGQADKTTSDIQEKKRFKRKIAGFYDMLDKFQGRLRRDNQKIDSDLVAKQNFLKQLSSAHDKSYALHKLVKDSIAETYDEVKNNPRASTIKRYVCSAKSYFKNAKKV